MFGRAFVNLLGASAVLGALMAAGLPLGLNAVDRAGTPIPCGNALRPSYEVAVKQDRFNLDQATLSGPGFIASDYAAQCQALVGRRWRVAGAVAGAGVMVVVVAYGLPRLVHGSGRGRHARYGGTTEAVRHQPDQAGVRPPWGADQIGTGITQPILEESVGEQVGRHNYVSVAAAALRGDGRRDGWGRRPALHDEYRVHGVSTASR